MEKEAIYYVKLENSNIQCNLCPWHCFITPGEVGKCRVRKNNGEKLISLNYEKPCSLAIDPIEKKPLYHFLPGQETLSIATLGCNLSCGHCQNWEISQASSVKKNSLKVPAEEVVNKAIGSNVKIISYTYTEPTIFYEYMADISKLARKKKIKNIIVSNGFINEEPLKELCKLIDAGNIDLKSISEDFYQTVCKARLNPVLEAIKILHKEKVWIELTNLLIPELNDSKEDIKDLIGWVKENLGVNVPVHFTVFYPTYKMINLPATKIEKLKEARKIALDAGLKYVYTGNLQDDEGNNTYCHSCNKILIKRRGFNIIENNLENGKCPRCKEKIPGVWK